MPYFVARVHLTARSMKAAVGPLAYGTRDGAWESTRAGFPSIARLERRIPLGEWMLVEADDLHSAMREVEKRAATVEWLPFEDSSAI